MYIQHIYKNNSLSKCMVCDGNWLRLAIFSWMSLNSCEVSILIQRAKDQSMRKESATGRANCIHIKKWLKTQRTLYRFVGITIASKRKKKKKQKKSTIIWKTKAVGTKQSNWESNSVACWCCYLHTSDGPHLINGLQSTVIKRRRKTVPEHYMFTATTTTTMHRNSEKNKIWKQKYIQELDRQSKARHHSKAKIERIDG